VFVDKDGTLLDDVAYNVDVERMVLAEGAGSALRLIQSRGYRVIVISNQSGVARGYFDERALQAVEHRLGHMLSDEGVRLTAFYYCPHLAGGAVARYAVDCSCRKPAPGLVLRAADDHGVDLARSWVVGDILDDVEAGRRAGCTTILVANGNETEWNVVERRRPDYVVGDLRDAASIIAGVASEDAITWARREVGS
jgi:histidinol-phosphate phosphatase family protein